MRISLIGLNVLALSALLGAAWLMFRATQAVAPVDQTGELALYTVFGLGASACLLASLQFARRRRMHAWGAITPMVVGSLLLAGGFLWLVLNATLPR